MMASPKYQAKLPRQGIPVDLIQWQRNEILPRRYSIVKRILGQFHCLRKPLTQT